MKRQQEMRVGALLAKQLGAQLTGFLKRPWGPRSAGALAAQPSNIVARINDMYRAAVATCERQEQVFRADLGETKRRYEELRAYLVGLAAGAGRTPPSSGYVLALEARLLLAGAMQLTPITGIAIAPDGFDWLVNGAPRGSRITISAGDVVAMRALEPESSE